MSLKKRKNTKELNPELPEDEDEDEDPTYNPNESESESESEIKVVFTKKYKTPILKKTKTCIGTVCSIIKKYYTEFFVVDESICTHEKVKEFFGQEYESFYKLEKADFKDSIITLLKPLIHKDKSLILIINYTTNFYFLIKYY